MKSHVADAPDLFGDIVSHCGWTSFLDLRNKQFQGLHEGHFCYTSTLPYTTNLNIFISLSAWQGVEQRLFIAYRNDCL